jgi:hypothetical protein
MEDDECRDGTGQECTDCDTGTGVSTQNPHLQQRTVSFRRHHQHHHHRLASPRGMAMMACDGDRV